MNSRQKIIKSFDLEAVKKGAKVETRDGAQVKDLIYRETEYPIEGFYKAEDGCWVNGCWKIDGHWDDSEFDGLDLVIVEYEGEEVPMDCPKQEPNTRQLWDEYTIELTDCDNGIFCKVHDFTPDAEDAFLVYKREEQEQMLGKFLMDSIRAKMNCDLCSKVRIEMKIFSETK